MIIKMLSQDEETYPQGSHSTYDGKPKNYCLAHTHIGLCVSEWERNMYDDSDFYMVVYNPEEDTFENICFATTRGWTYPCYNSCVDATEEIRERYKKYQEEQYQERLRMQEERRQEQKKKACTDAKISEKEYDRLASALNPEDLGAVIKLLSTNLRSDFRKSLARQVREWLADSEPRYQSPLSPKQLQYV